VNARLGFVPKGTDSIGAGLYKNQFPWKGERFVSHEWAGGEITASPLQLPDGQQVVMPGGGEHVLGAVVAGGALGSGAGTGRVVGGAGVAPGALPPVSEPGALVGVSTTPPPPVCWVATGAGVLSAGVVGAGA